MDWAWELSDVARPQPYVVPFLPCTAEAMATWQLHGCRETMKWTRSVTWRRLSSYYMAAVQTEYNQKSHRHGLEILDPIIIAYGEGVVS